jgi:NTP pyrophosphatase (non-canonical NTP hydrolase)
MKPLIASIREFNRARNWQRYKDPRSTVLAICSEAGELAHVFRWRRSSRRALPPTVVSAAADEIADVLIFSIVLCDQLGIDPQKAVTRKLRLNAQKYPAARE